MLDCCVLDCVKEVVAVAMFKRTIYVCVYIRIYSLVWMTRRWRVVSGFATSGMI
jgi:hypothetical protein